MLRTLTDRLLRPLAKQWREDPAMKLFGIERLRRFAKGYNRWRYAQRAWIHREAYENGFESLLRENGPLEAWPPRMELRDGWARDNSHTLPHLERMLEQAGEIIRERGGRKHSSAQQPFLRGLLFPGDLATYPAILDFILSSEVLAIAARHLQTTPVLSKTLPPGVRFMESNAALDPDAAVPSESQLYHLDLRHAAGLCPRPRAGCDGRMRSLDVPAGIGFARARSALDQQPGVEYRDRRADMRVIDRAKLISPAKGRRALHRFQCLFHYGSRRSVRHGSVDGALTTPAVATSFRQNGKTSILADSASCSMLWSRGAAWGEGSLEVSGQRV
jgi:hypothetical protein